MRFISKKGVLDCGAIESSWSVVLSESFPTSKLLICPHTVHSRGSLRRLRLIIHAVDDIQIFLFYVLVHGRGGRGGGGIPRIRDFIFAGQATHVNSNFVLGKGNGFLWKGTRFRGF